MAQWLEQASQWPEMYPHGLEVMSRVELYIEIKWLFVGFAYTVLFIDSGWHPIDQVEGILQIM